MSATGAGPEVEIRTAIERDLPVLLSLWEQLERAQGRFRPVPVGADARERIERAIVAAIGGETSCVFVAESHGAAVGMAIAAPDRLGGMTDEMSIAVSRVVVAEEWRGRGVGALLVAEAERFARRLGFGWLSAKIFSGNEASRRFWDREGFVSYYEAMLRRLE